MTSTRPLTASIISDHDELREYHSKYLDAKTDNDARNAWANQFRWKLAIHSVAEELIWYPAIERAFPGEEGKKMADKNRMEHQQVKEDLEQFEKLNINDPEFAMIFAKIFRELGPHLEDEEQNELPAFEEKISEEESASLAKQFERTKKMVPTRSHPMVPSKPPFETIAGMLSLPMDKLKDAFSSFPDASEVNK